MTQREKQVVHYLVLVAALVKCHGNKITAKKA